MKKIIIMMTSIIASLILIGCNIRHEPVDIYTSIYPLEFMTKEIVGDHLSVRSIYPRGADVHEFEPPASVIINMAKSKGIFYIGAGLEGFMVSAANTTFANMSEKLLELSKFVTLVEPGFIHESSDPHHNGFGYDPHIWLDPLRMIVMAEKILERVIDIMPEQDDVFRDNAADLIKRLNKLDDDFIASTEDPRIIRKIILVDHDAYIYWEERYGIERMRARVDNHSCEVIPKVFFENLALIEQYGIKHIAVTAYEYQCAVTNQYVQQANLTKVTLHHLATISDDDFEQNKDYFELMYQNLSILRLMFPKTE